MNIQRWTWLEGLNLFEKSRISKVTGVFVGALGRIAVGQHVLAEKVGHGSISLVVTVVQQVLQKSFVPSTDIICVENTRIVSKCVPATIVGHDAEEQVNLGNLDGMRLRAISVNSVGDVVGVRGGAAQRNTVPAFRHAHRDLKFVAFAGGEEVVFGVAIAFTILWVDAFCYSLGLGNVKTTDHLESIGKGSGLTSVPDIVGTGLGHDVAFVGAGVFIVLVYSWMPVHGFVFLNISRIFTDGSIHQTRVKFEGIIYVNSARINSRLRAIKGVNVIAWAIVAQNGVDTTMSDGKTAREIKISREIQCNAVKKESNTTTLTH